MVKMSNNNLNQQWINRIYYAAIAMNNEAIADVVNEISKHGHALQSAWQQPEDKIYVLYFSDYDGGCVIRAYINEADAKWMAKVCNDYQLSIPKYTDYAPAEYDAEDKWFERFEADMQIWNNQHPLGPDEGGYCSSSTGQYVVYDITLEK